MDRSEINRGISADTLAEGEDANGNEWERTEATGQLREAILARVGKTDGVVTLVETRTYGGYCETCAYIDYDIKVEVDGEVVYEEDDATSLVLGLDNWLNPRPPQPAGYVVNRAVTPAKTLQSGDSFTVSYTVTYD